MAEKEKGLTIIIGADTSKFSKGLRELNTPINRLKSELKHVESALKLDPTNTKLIQQKTDLLAKSVSSTKTKYQELKKAADAYENSVGPKTQEEINAYNRVQRELVETKAKMKEVVAEQARWSLQSSKLGVLNTKLNGMQPYLDKIGNKFMSLTKRVGQFAGALAGISLYKAFAKLENLNDVNAVFEQFVRNGTLTQKAMNGITDAITNSVSGTKYALTDMTKIAKGAFSSLKNEGIGMEDYLKRIADISATTGANLGTMGTIFNKTLAKGKADAKILNSLMANGVPIIDDLANAYGVTKQEIDKMVSSGQIGMKEIMFATQKYGGMATETAMATVGGATTILSQRWTNVGVAFLEGAYEPMKSGLVNLANFLGDNMDTIKDWGAQFGSVIKALIKYVKTGKTDTDGFSGAFKTLFEIVKPIVGLISTLVKGFMNLSPGMKKFVVLTALAIGPVLKMTSGLITGFNAVFQFAKSVKATFAVMKTFGSVMSLSGALPILGIVAAITAVVAGIVLLIKNWDKVKKMAKKVAKGIISAWEGIKDFFANLSKEIGEKAKEFLDIGKTMFTNLWKGIKSVGSTVLNVAVTIIKTVVTGYAKYYSKLFDIGKTLVQNLWNGIKSLASWIGTNAQKFAKEIPTKIKTGLGNLQTIAGNFATSLWTGISNKVSTIKSKVSSFAKEIPKKIKNGLGSLKTIGGNLITGLWNGINNKVKWLKNKISGFVGNVKSWLKKFFKIGSPSKLMRDEIGRWIPEGVAVGITDNMKSVKDALGTMTSKSIPELSEANLSLMNNASVTQPQSSGIDYQRLTNVFIQALDQITFINETNMDGKVIATEMTPLINRKLQSRSVLDGRYA